MSARHLAGALSVAAAACVLPTAIALTAIAPTALAEPQPDTATRGCSDVEVVFARGTTEPPGVGAVGQAFVDALRSKVSAKTVDVYAVDYPATIDFPRAVDGINDAAAHIQATAARCPKTKIVLGGYSQGAAVAGFVTSDVVPPGAVDSGVTGPMPPAVADHVAAVVLFGKPSPRFMGFIDEPNVVVGPLYAAKTLDSCVPGDPICSDDGGDYALHNEYITDGLPAQAADFVVGRLGPVPPAPTTLGPAPTPALAPVIAAPADPAPVAPGPAQPQ